MNTSAKTQSGPAPIERAALKINEFAEACGVSPISIRRAIEKGQIRVCRKFRHVLIPATELEKFLS